MKQYRNKETNEIVEAKWESFYKDKPQPKHWSGEKVPQNLILSKRKFKKLYEEIKQSDG